MARIQIERLEHSEQEMSAAEAGQIVNSGSRSSCHCAPPSWW